MKRTFAILLSLCLLLPISTAFASAEDDAWLDGFLIEALGSAHIPGAAVAVVSADGVLFSEAYGNAASADQPFIIGSMTKSFTALAIMQLAEQGKLGLDDSLSKYPHPGIPDAFIADRVTIRHMLNQDSGIRAYHAPQVKEMFTQGDFYYSNANYALLGMVVEVASGTSYAEYVQRNIFDPIGMENSHATRQRALDGGLIKGYKNYFGLQIPVDITWPDYQLAAGYLSVSANDIAKYMQMYMNGGTANGNRVISAESIEQMWTIGAVSPGSEPANAINDMSRYGMGWFINQYNGERAVSHGGSVENFSSFMAILPDRQRAFVVLFNSDDFIIGEDFRSNIIDGILAYTLGEKNAQPLPSNKYWTGHLLLDGIMLIFMLACLLPLLLRKRFKRRLSAGLGRGRRIWNVFLHVALPIAIIAVLVIIPYPFDIMIGFMPDLTIVGILGPVVLLATGVYKLVLALKHRAAGA